MTIMEKLQSQMKEAMRTKDKENLATIRLMIDKIQKKEKSVLRQINEEECVNVLQTFKKQVEEELEYAVKANDNEKINKLKWDIELISCYIPQMLSNEEIYVIVANTANELIKSTKNGEISVGLLMKNVMPLVKGKADNKIVSEIVKQYI
jgi:uncharacterized protein YqeY